MIIRFIKYKFKLIYEVLNRNTVETNIVLIFIGLRLADKILYKEQPETVIRFYYD
jgi:hypothetical protein